MNPGLQNQGLDSAINDPRRQSPKMADGYDFSVLNWDTEEIQAEEAYNIDGTKQLHLFLKRKINDSIKP